jgi:DNA-directed RNA polymerase subunit RPC12/RpoP
MEQIGGGGVNEAGSYKMSYSSLPPYCEECEAILEESIILEAINNKHPIECPKCSHKMPVRIADEDVREFHPKAIAVVNDSEGIDAGIKSAEDKISTVVIKCMTCSAGLEITSNTKRTVKCQYCDNENYLPDNIWQKLHPHKDTEPFFVILDINENDLKDSLQYFLNVTALKIYEKHFYNFTREMFEKPFLNDSLKSWLKILLNDKTEDKIGVNLKSSALQKYFYQQFALGIDKHDIELKKLVAECSSTIPEDIQNLLAKDKDDSVRFALAKNKNIESKIIKQLRNDPNPQVSQAAKEQKTGLFKGLFG